MTDQEEILQNGEPKAVTDAKSLQPSAGTIEDILSQYLIDFVIEDDTVLGYIEDWDIFKEILCKMKNLGFTFSVRDSDVRQKQREKILKMSTNDKSSEEIKETDLYAHLTFFYQFKAMPIKFFGQPFTIDKTTHYQCAYGCKYYKSRAMCAVKKSENSTLKPPKKIKKIGSKKMGCLAKMTIKHITVYPDYELDIESDWRKKKKLIENLRRDLTDSNKVVQQLQRFYLSVSVQSSHNHPPIINEPKTDSTKKLLKVRKNRKKMEISAIKSASEENELGYEDIASSSIKVEETQEEPKTLNLKDDSFFHSLVKFPNATPAVFEQVEYRPNEIEIEVKPYEFSANTSTIEIYEYQPTLQDLQTVFKEKLKNLYTLCMNCSNAPLILKLASDLEQIEVQLVNDVNFNNS